MSLDEIRRIASELRRGLAEPVGSGYLASRVTSLVSAGQDARMSLGPPYDVECPKCGAGVDKFCRYEGHTRDLHDERWNERVRSIIDAIDAANEDNE